MLSFISVLSFSFWCTAGAGLLAFASKKEYKFIAYLVFAEFAISKLAYTYLLLDFRAENSGVIYLIYIIIQCSILGLMNLFQTHKIIAVLIFANLSYNLFTVLQHIGIFMYIPLTDIFINFHLHFKTIVRTIMILELIYLLGITSYVGNYIRKHAFLDVNYIDDLFFIRRRLFVGNMA